MNLEIVRASNHLVVAWSIIWKGRRVGSIVHALDRFLVTRTRKIEKYPGYEIEVAAYANTFGEAAGWVMDSVESTGHKDENKADI